MANDMAGLRVGPPASVRDATAAISANGRQIALVVDDADVLVGVVTDGDVRRDVCEESARR